MTKVTIREGESLDSALRRFRKTLEKTGVLQDVRKHERYEKPSEKRRRIKARAERRRTR